MSMGTHQNNLTFLNVTGINARDALSEGCGNDSIDEYFNLNVVRLGRQEEIEEESRSGS